MNANVMKTKSGQVKLLAVVAIFAMIACALAVASPVSATEPTELDLGAVTEDSTSISTDTVLKGTLDRDLTIDYSSGTITVDTAGITISEGVTLTLKGTGIDNLSNALSMSGGAINVHGSILASKDITLSGTFNTYSTTNLGGVVLTGTVEYVTEDVQFQFQGRLGSSTTIYDEQSLVGDLWIPEGVTLTIASGGVLNLNGFGIYVQGTLAVNANGAVKNIATTEKTSTVGAGTLLLHRDGAIQNEGVIGSGSPVTVSAQISKTDKYDAAFTNADLSVNYNAVGAVEMLNVTGISYSIENVNNVRYLTITGDITAYGMNGVYTVDATDVRVAGELSIGEDVVFTADQGSVTGFDYTKGVTLKSGATVNIDGELVAEQSDFVMTNNSTVVVDGTVTGVITAQTGDFVTKDGIGTSTTTVAFANATGATLSVGQTTYTEDNTAKTKQILYISGNVDVVDADTNGGAGSVTIVNSAATQTVSAGISMIAADAVLSLDDKVSFKGGNTVVEGQIVYTDGDVTEVVGTGYTIPGATSKDDVKYVTSFEYAYSQIANAKNTTITVYGDLDIEIDVVLADKQKIVFDDDRNITVKIDKDAELTAQKGAVITGTVDDVQGVLTVYNGASVSKPGSYAVYKETTEFRQYSGLIPAINNAVAGDVIDVENDVTVEDDMTIIAGVTINNSAEMTFEKNLVIEETAVFNNEGSVRMVGEKSTITVNGTMDNSEGQAIGFYDKVANSNPVQYDIQSANNGTRAIYSTGSMIITSAMEANLTDYVNAAKYTNDDTNVVYTTVAKAVAAVEAQDNNSVITVYGTVSQSEDITLGAETDLTIETGAKVTLGTVTLTAASSGNGSEVTVNGELTATIAGMTGAEGATAESAVELSRASAAKVIMYSYTDDMNVKNDYLMLGGTAATTVKGAVTVSAGTVNAAISGLSSEVGINQLVVNGDKNSLTVASGATLAVEKIGNNTATLTVGSNDKKAAVIVDGTIAFIGGALDETGTQIMDVNGTMTVSEGDVTVEGTLNVTGTLSVSTTEDEEGTVTLGISGDIAVLVVGEKPETVGATGAGVVTGAVKTTYGYIKAYAGADLSGASIDMETGAEESAAESAEYYINGDLYMTIVSACDDVNANYVIGGAGKETFDLAGIVTKDTETELDINVLTQWYTDADMSQNVTSDSLSLEDAGALYFKAPASEVQVTVSVGSGISIYIDDVRYNSGDKILLTVGTHTVSATVDPGYSGTVNIAFAGQSVTNGQFEITAEMASNAYQGTLAISATGDITQDSTVIGGGSSGSDSGMGLTDYLLIILVILIVVMAIMVAMRLMRS